MKAEKPQGTRRLEVDAVTSAKHSFFIPVLDLKNTLDHIQDSVSGPGGLLHGLFHICGKIKHEKREFGVGSFAGQDFPLSTVSGSDKFEPFASPGTGYIIANGEIQKKRRVDLECGRDLTQGANGRRCFSTFYLRNVSCRNPYPGLDILEGKALGKA